MEPRFEFYEEVIIKTSGNRDVSKGAIGVVLGRTESSEHKSFYYAVFVSGVEECYCFFEHELESTGRRFSREDFYTGETVSLVVDDRGFARVVKKEL